MAGRRRAGAFRSRASGQRGDPGGAPEPAAARGVPARHAVHVRGDARGDAEPYATPDREPTDIELETLAQTWSEHCVHKTLKSTVQLHPPTPSETASHKPGHELRRRRLGHHRQPAQATVAAATVSSWRTASSATCVSVFDDNAGIVKFDDSTACASRSKRTTTPRPSSPTAAPPPASAGASATSSAPGSPPTDRQHRHVFCVAADMTPTTCRPASFIHPRRILERVVAGVRDYGNRMGIPTVDGGVYFHDDYLGNPLVFAAASARSRSTTALRRSEARRPHHRPRRRDRPRRHPRRDVQLRRADRHPRRRVLPRRADRQRDHREEDARRHPPGPRRRGGPLFSAITDCGAGGFSSAVGEMGEKSAPMSTSTAPRSSTRA